MAKRTPVTARGAELLALIAAANDGTLMLTQDEGAEAVAAGHAVVDTAKVEGNTAAVSLTDAGKAVLSTTTATATGAASAAGFVIDTDVPVPTKAKRKARSGGYPFEALQIGQSFHVPKPSDLTIEQLLARLSSSVSGARAKFAEATGGKVEAKVRTYKRTEDGKGFVKDEAGKRVVESERTETRDETRPTRDFAAYVAEDNDPRGPGVRVFRVAVGEGTGSDEGDDA